MDEISFERVGVQSGSDFVKRYESFRACSDFNLFFRYIAVKFESLEVELSDLVWFEHGSASGLSWDKGNGFRFNGER